MEPLKSVTPPRHQYKLVGVENLREIEAIPLVGTNKKSLCKIYKCSDRVEFPTSLLRFWPVYYADGSSESAKEEAWKRVLRKSPPEDEEIIDVYLSAIRRVEQKASAVYAGETLDRFTESQFRWLIIKDGCFFLQLALFILGASNKLGYPDNHISFGKKQEKKFAYGWIKSMYYAGNQIPLLVLTKLTKQAAFFRKVIKDHRKWERPTEKQPSDLLHGLQNLVLGPRVSRNDSNEEEDEEDEKEGQDWILLKTVRTMKVKNVN